MLVELARYYDSFTAGAAQSRLTADGIDSHLFDLGMAPQAMGVAIPIRLMVDESDLEEARRSLEI